MKKADLHIHTTFSDGSLTPNEIVKWASKKKVHAIAITDHDTVEGIKATIESAILYDIITIAGIEISCTMEEEEVHILGYFIDYEDNNLLNMTKLLKESRESRGEKIIEKLNYLGFEISLEDVYDISGTGVIGRPHIAKAMIKKEYVNTIEEAFGKYLNRNKPAYVERYKLSIEDGINLIHRAGGVAVIAHPGLVKSKKVIYEAIRLNVDGIEAIHSKHSEQDVIKYSEIGNKYNLIITGGSDFHGNYNNNVPVLGDYYIDYEQVILLKKKANSIRKGEIE
ncbi:PHP domain-containing protein [Proteiniborus sp.]|uniref:PHP domain-containing protein n=1 Tax=Proteiniborus sp. TaxID=2079015 RepID=UPI003319B8CB